MFRLFQLTLDTHRLFECERAYNHRVFIEVLPNYVGRFAEFLFVRTSQTHHR